MRALLTGSTHGIGEATAWRLCPLVEVLVLHRPEAPGDVRAAGATRSSAAHGTS